MAGANLQVSDKFVLIGYVIVCVFVHSLRFNCEFKIILPPFYVNIFRFILFPLTLLMVTNRPFAYIEVISFIPPTIL